MIRYPFPNMKLAGNTRTDRRYTTQERQQARSIGYWITRDAGIQFSGEKWLEYYFKICPPDKRRRDDDNIYSAFKSTRDGIFLALELDDRLIKRTIIEWGVIEKDGAIYIELREL